MTQGIVGFRVVMGTAWLLAGAAGGAMAQPLPQLVQPQLECIEGDRERFVGHFGYQSYANTSLEVPVTPENNIFIGGGVNPNVGQPSLFVPGRHRYVFSAMFESQEAPEYRWYLGSYMLPISLDSPSCAYAGPARVYAFATCASIDPLSGQGVARFGYYNAHGAALGYRVPHTHHRTGTGPITAAGAWRGQPEVLQPGLHPAAFTAQFDPAFEDGVVWQLEQESALAVPGLPGLPACAADMRLEISGSGQMTLPETGFAAPLRLRARAADGTPLAGRSVLWRGRAITAGPDAIVLSADATTDAEGQAQAQVMANHVPGAYLVIAMLPEERISAAFHLQNVTALPPEASIFRDSFE